MFALAPATRFPSAAASLAAFWLMATLVFPSPAPAQTLVGHVVDEATREPLRGAFVVLEDSAGTRHEGVLTRPDGRFVLRAGTPGTYRAVAQMIGYASIRTDFFTLGAGQTVRRELEAPVEAITLEGIEVSGEARCRSTSGTGTERLWEEARKALEVARWSDAQGQLRFHIAEHRRELDARTLAVEAESQRRRSGYSDRSPYHSIPAEELEARGYVQGTRTETLDYYAPDADVLLSDSFLRTHCFRVVLPPDDEDELIGLGFEPVPGRDVPEIEGTLWLERGTAELRRLDFRYVNLPAPYPDWPEVGGRVEFERLATGAWVIPRWYIRMPLQIRRTRDRSGAPGQLILETLSETGARVESVRTAGGEVLAEAAGATLYGTVTDEDGGALADVRVRIASLDRAARTGPDGAYRLGELPDGTYDVSFRTPVHALLGAGGEERTVTVGGGRARRLAVELGREDEEALVREICAELGWGGGEAEGRPLLLYGVVRAPGGETAVPGALVRIGIDGRERHATADSAGVYRICLEPTAAPLRVVAALRGSALERRPLESLDVVDVDAPAPGLVRADPALTAAAVAPRETAEAADAAVGMERWANALIGMVAEEGSGRPIRHAVASLVDSAGITVQSVLTNDAGEFRFLHPGVEVFRYTLVVEHPDYGRAAQEVEFEPAQEVEVEVILAPVGAGEG